MSPAHLLLSPHGPGLDRRLVIPIAALDVVSTTLHVGGAPSELPTLLTVERIIGRLSDLGLALSDPEQAKKLAGVINKCFLPVAADNWVDTQVRLEVVRAGTPADLDALQAVSALRPPTLHAAGTVLAAGPDYVFGSRRANENKLVQGLEEAVEAKRGIWAQHGRSAFRFLTTTVMGVLVEHLVGIPLTDIIRTTLSGALRTVT